MHSGSLRSFRRSLGIVVFIWFVGFVRKRPVGRRKYNWGSLGSLGRTPVGRRVHSGSLGLFGHALGVVSIIGVRWVG